MLYHDLMLRYGCHTPYLVPMIYGAAMDFGLSLSFSGLA